MSAAKTRVLSLLPPIEPDTGFGSWLDAAEREMFADLRSAECGPLRVVETVRGACVVRRPRRRGKEAS